MKGFLNKDERQIIYRKLHPADWEIWRVAHNPQYEPTIQYWYMIKYNYIDLIKWVYSNISPIKWNQDSAMIIMNAIYYEQVDILEWCYSRCRQVDYANTFEYATRHGKIRSLQWFHLNAKEFENLDIRYLCNSAIECGQLNILRWINSVYPLWYQNDAIEWNQTVIEWARIHGYTEMLEWAQIENILTNEGVPE